MTTDSATKIHYSPLAECRWAYLIDPREQLEKDKPLAWSCQLILPASDPKTIAFHKAIEDTMAATHGTRKKVSEKGMPIKLDDKDPTRMIARFKALQLTRKDGSTAPGPKVIDSRKQPWDGSQIGNGSKLVIAFKYHGWDRPEGVGLTLIPTAVQVVHFVPYVTDDGVDGFEEQEGGYSVPGFAEEFEDEFA